LRCARSGGGGLVMTLAKREASLDTTRRSACVARRHGIQIHGAERRDVSTVRRVVPKGLEARRVARITIA
jgi:hypothetical protein